ncbi:hypothetical protein D1816_02580 [Aquimarina sp. AD10]|uniref:hypothetical protein n=1 Tax=Aquimarina sp. AD10 TaxID=1714849 RepID=UPI000E49A3C0|nr:hypothetical protein [Aquimarina sp. AD10]AXT59279.1 hypothetical protein D1816_02580 [Aquimarina sp. AD10]RKM92435.1 hypothetical protein D7033_20940 [Aquimarina sp. AD10]
MEVYKVKDKYLIFKGDNSSEKKFRMELSEKILSKFGKPSYDAEKITEILNFSLEYFIDNFQKICLNETSVRFYQQILRFHEQATEVVYKFSNESISEEIDFKYIAIYRRVLKFILEMGCDVSMHNNEKMDGAFKKRFEEKLNDLLYLGDMIFTCVSFYSEQTMIEDVADISFDKDNLFVFSRRHHYNFIFEHMSKEFGPQLSKAVVDDTDLAGLSDLKKALENCFNIKYGNVGHLIASIHEMNKSKGGDVVGVGWETLPINLTQAYGVEKQVAEQFFRGLTLDRNNKMPLLDLACKPYKLNRYIYKPIIIWNIDGNDYALFGKNAWAETFIQLASNAIPWGKAPETWLKNKCFKKYVHRKEDDHDKWLDDAVEKKMSENDIYYDRNVKVISHNSGKTSIDVKDLGEIDFIIASKETQKLYIADCKHLLGRYDIANQRNDYNAFTGGKKPYNETLKRKVKWFNDNLSLVNQHLQIKYKNPKIDISGYSVEGIFIINTPTFYMYNSVYRIYDINQIENVVLGKHIDPTFSVVIEEEDQTKLLNIEYPYFKKPKYVSFDPFKDEE